MKPACSVLLLGLVGCPEYNPQKTPEPGGTEGAAIEVTPNLLDFGLLEAGESSTLSFHVASVGDVAVQIADVRLAAGSFTLPVASRLGTLSPGESFDVDVVYTASHPADAAWVAVSSDDPVTPEARVQLLGGTLGPAISLDPSWVRFGSVVRGTIGEEAVNILNVGTAPLTVSSVTVTGEGFWLSQSPEAPMVIPAGDSAPITVSFSPPASGSFTGTLWVASDAPTATLSAPLDGVSGLPIAVCRAEPPIVDANAEASRLVGSDSYDAEGGTLVAWDWILLMRPPGSGAVLPAISGPVIEDFRPDLAGVYEFALVVENDAGLRSEACITTVEAVPSQDLWVELSWENPGDDMDLHLLAPGGSLTSDTDCYFANCVGGGLDWGASREGYDNPRLDLDDIPGTGPENVNIASPSAGVYAVYVHDYPGSVYSATNEIYVRIYLGGALAWEGTRVMAGENDYTAIADIDWPAGTVTPY